MQTFLPHPDYRKATQALDSRRLGRQIMESALLLRGLRQGPTRADGRPTPWYHHPASLMWRGYEGALAEYALACCHEWRRRMTTPRVEEAEIAVACAKGDPAPPPWLDDSRFHAGHRGHLYRKDSEQYAAFVADANAQLLYPAPNAIGGFCLVERLDVGVFRVLAIPPDSGPHPTSSSVRGAVKAAWRV